MGQITSTRSGRQSRWRSVIAPVGATPLLSDDGGVTWTSQAVNGAITGNLDSVACSSATTCVIVGPNPDGVTQPTAPATAIITTDGGSTWNQEVFPASTASLHYISCVAGTTQCVATGQSPTTTDPAIFDVSDDGGVTWAPGSPVPEKVFTPSAITCPAANSCAEVGHVIDGDDTFVNLKFPS
jgi:photosystem II stability/assembly factor-like uncharacterized protein